MQELNNPSVAEDQRRFRKLMKEQADLAPIVEAYKEYKQAKQDIEDLSLIHIYSLRHSRHGILYKTVKQRKVDEKCDYRRGNGDCHILYFRIIFKGPFP